jgi:hypothetical protein
MKSHVMTVRMKYLSVESHDIVDEKMCHHIVKQNEGYSPEAVEFSIPLFQQEPYKKHIT